VPLTGDGAAVAEHHQMIKVTFLSHALEAQQCAQGLAGARTGMQ